MQQINKDSDLIIKTSFQNEGGFPIEIPDYDFEFAYFVYPGKVIKAGKTGSEFYNCAPDGAFVVVAIDAPNFSVGVLKCTKTYLIPDESFPDGIRKLVSTSEIARIC